MKDFTYVSEVRADFEGLLSEYEERIVLPLDEVYQNLRHKDYLPLEELLGFHLGRLVRDEQNRLERYHDSLLRNRTNKPVLSRMREALERRIEEVEPLLHRAKMLDANLDNPYIYNMSDSDI